MNYDEFNQRSKNKEEQNSCTSINCFAATFVREVNLPAKGIIPAEVRSIVHIIILWCPLQKTMCQTIVVLLTVSYVCIIHIDTYIMYIYIYTRIFVILLYDLQRQSYRRQLLYFSP